MSYIPLYNLLPDIAMKETRIITAFEPNMYGVPAGEYGLVEMYCEDEHCDCQRVFLTVTSSGTQGPVAVITFGWESKQFYAKWFNYGKDTPYFAMAEHDREAVDFMHGIHLSTTDRQSSIAPAVLKMVTETALKDVTYVNRLKRHYKLFREKIDEE